MDMLQMLEIFGNYRQNMISLSIPGLNRVEEKSPEFTPDLTQALIIIIIITGSRPDRIPPGA